MPAGNPIVDVIVPAHNCASRLAPTLAGVPMRHVRSLVVVDNGSTDTTAQVALDAGAVVLREPRLGYGAACQRAIAHLSTLPQPPEVVVFMAGDGRDDPEEIPRLVEPLRADNAELVIGVAPPAGSTVSRARDRIALGLIGAIYRYRFEDVGAFRAIRLPALVALGLIDRGSGWNVEMQVKAVKLGLHIVEVDVSPTEVPGPRERGIVGSVGTTGRMLFHILRHATAR